MQTCKGMEESISYFIAFINCFSNDIFQKVSGKMISNIVAEIKRGFHAEAPFDDTENQATMSILK